ncbi:MAG: hypothetical protein ACK523_08480, partial [Pirellulaceae bacterium]
LVGGDHFTAAARSLPWNAIAWLASCQSQWEGRSFTGDVSRDAGLRGKFRMDLAIPSWRVARKELAGRPGADISQSLWKIAIPPECVCWHKKTRRPAPAG